MCSMTRESLSKPFGPVLITLCVLKHAQQNFDTVFGPPTLCPAPLFTLDTPTNPTIIRTMEWHTLLLSHAILQILGGFSNLRTFNGLGSFTSVFKVNVKIRVA